MLLDRTGSLTCLRQAEPSAYAFSVASLMHLQSRMQDELAELALLRKLWREEAAKPKQDRNQILLDALNNDISNLTAKERMLMDEHARWLEAQARGERSFQ